jgi:hypothetical protein
VKKLLSIALTWASLVVMLSFVMAGSFKREPGYKAQAQSEDNLPVVRPRNVAPQSRSMARIIHVPQMEDRASVNDRYDDDIAPPVRRRVAPAMQRQDDFPQRQRAPRWQPRSEAPPLPQEPRRAMLNAAPPLAEGPTPIRPIPKLNSQANPIGKFGPPREVRSSAPPPPPGYSPPSNLPDGG